MAFSDRITLQDDTPADQHFDSTTKQSNSTLRRDASRNLDQPYSMTISHETTKDKKRVNSAVYFDRVELDSGDNVTLGNLRCLFKLSYDNQQIDATMIQETVAQLKEFLSSANITKLLNQEH